MTKEVFNYIIITTFAMWAAFSSCTKENEYKPNIKEKLLETITYASGWYSKFEYDNRNRVTKYSEFNDLGTLMEITIVTYNGDVLTRIDYKNLHPFSGRPYDVSSELTKNGNIITVKRTHSTLNLILTTLYLHINNKGLLEKNVEEGGIFSVVNSYKYHNENCVNYTYIYIQEGKIVEEYSLEYKFDDKKSPYYSCKTPKWFWFFTNKNFSAFSQNNAIEEKYGEGLYPEQITRWEYVYDRDGYPIKRIFIGSLGETWATEFQYKE